MCEVSIGTPFADSSFDESWLKPNDEQHQDLRAIQDFNNGFDANANGTIDPQLTFSNPNTPGGRHNAAYNASSNGLAETLGPESGAYGTYPTTDFGGNGTSGRFFQSIETTPAPAYQSLPPRNHPFRRSVSEPPGGPGMPPPPPPQLPMTFHRDNHYLGQPQEPEEAQPMSLKSLPKNKQQRRHPYPQHKIAKGGYEQLRPEHRRTQTQPVYPYAPTSAPVHMQATPQYMPHAMMRGYPYNSARVCTPSPGAGMVQSPPQMIDPALSAPSTPSEAKQQTNNKPSSAISISLTVEELRSLIVEAVQQAVEAAAQKATPSERESATATSPAQVVTDQESQEDQKSQENISEQFINDE